MNVSSALLFSPSRNHHSSRRASQALPSSLPFSLSFVLPQCLRNPSSFRRHRLFPSILGEPNWPSIYSISCTTCKPLLFGPSLLSPASGSPCRCRLLQGPLTVFPHIVLFPPPSPSLTMASPFPRWSRDPHNLLDIQIVSMPSSFPSPQHHQISSTRLNILLRKLHHRPLHLQSLSLAIFESLLHPIFDLLRAIVIPNTS